MDVCAIEMARINAGATRLMSTGLAFEVPKGFELQVRPRSGLAAKFGLTVLNSPGTIDSDYRGELKVLLINLGDSDMIITAGDRIAQLVLAPVVTAKLVEVNELSETVRGAGGFGSTGG
jgi:dUTP pyrophosphatase